MIISKIVKYILLLAVSLPTMMGARAERICYSPDTMRVIRNPLQGWVMYLGRQWDENFWQEHGYDSMSTSDGSGSVNVSDYATCAYIRTSWASLEPEEGKYIWTDPDSRLMKLLKSVRDRGLRIAFRIVIDGRDQGQNTPQYVFDAGALGYYDPKAPGKNLSPYPDDPVFQEKYATFFKAFAERFDNPAEVEFVDAYSLGKWGESHSMIYKDNGNKKRVFEWMVDLASSSFHAVPMVIHYHRLLGDPDEDGWGEAATVSEHMINYALDRGFILRHDAFGMHGYYQDWEKEMASKWNFIRPIIMEGGWITGAHHRYWRDPSGLYREGHPEDVRHGEFDAAAAANVNMMDFRINDETRSWFEDAFPLVKEFVAKGGYRLYPSAVEAPDRVPSGETVDVVSVWHNIGWGYCPANIPQWKGRYKVGIALLDKDGNPVKTTIEECSDLSKWIKDNPREYKTRFDTSGVPSGEYTWGVALIDTTDENRPALEMAVDISLMRGGWLRAGSLEIL